MTCIIDREKLLYRGYLGIHGSCVCLRRHESMRWVKLPKDRVFWWGFVNTVMNQLILYRWLIFLQTERLTFLQNDFCYMESFIIYKAVDRHIFFWVSPDLIIYQKRLARTQFLKTSCNHIFMDLRVYLFLKIYYNLYNLFWRVPLLATAIQVDDWTVLVIYVKFNIEKPSCNHCFSRKSISTNCECVFVALVIQNAMGMCHIIICGLSDYIVFFHITSEMARF